MVLMEYKFYQLDFCKVNSFIHSLLDARRLYVSQVGESGVGMARQPKMWLVACGSWWQWGQIGEGDWSIPYW